MNSSNKNSQAFGAPGIEPRWTSSLKEGVATAYSTSSRVWFTLSHGILNEVYYPTIDRPQLRDLQLLITDGTSFFHEEKRDLINEIEPIEKDALGYKIVGRTPDERYRIVKEVIADPHQSCVLMNVRIEGADEVIDPLRVYVLASPHLEMEGMGNSGRRMYVAGKEILTAWKGGAYLALGVNTGFLKTSCGFVGASDGWQDLKENFVMDWQFAEALDGNIALMGQVDIPASREFTVGLAFGDSQHAAVTALFQSLAIRFESHRERFIEQWNRICCEMENLDAHTADHGRICRLSHRLLLAHEDKIFAGAIIASASIPWGEFRGDDDIGGYHLVWTRDLVKSATGLLAFGDTATPMRALVYLACSQNRQGGFAQNFWIDGTPYWTSIQLDEVAFPIILAWRLRGPCTMGDFDPYPMVLAGAGFLVRNGPVTQQERWEENSGYSPSTLAAEIAALVCAAGFARERNDSFTADYLEDYADFLESHIERWTVTTQGELVPGISRYYIRIHPVDIHDPSPNENPNHGSIVIANRGPGERKTFAAKDVVDAGFLELVRYGIRPANDPLIEDSLRVVDYVLKVNTPLGPCWRRYNHDGYGQRRDGGPFLGYGQGRAWPLLTGERGHYEFAAGRDPHPYLRAMEQFASKGGTIPEQVWDEPDRPEWGMYLGRPTGAATPLLWAHSEYVKLLRSVRDGEVFDKIPLVVERYHNHRTRGNLEVWLPVRQVRTVRRGCTLRVQCPAAFRLHWTADEWKNVHDNQALATRLGVYYCDIPIARDQSAPIRFTFFWTDQDRWEGKDYAVGVEAGEDYF